MNNTINSTSDVKCELLRQLEKLRELQTSSSDVNEIVALANVINSTVNVLMQHFAE